VFQFAITCYNIIIKTQHLLTQNKRPSIANQRVSINTNNFRRAIPPELNRPRNGQAQNGLWRFKMKHLDIFSIFKNKNRPCGDILYKFVAQTVYTVCKRINYKIVPVNNLNKYLRYGTSGTEYMYIKIGANNDSEKL